MSDNNDKMLHELEESATPVLADLVFTADSTANYEPKKLLLQALMELFLAQNPVIQVADDGTFGLKNPLDARGKKIHNLPKGADTKDAVRYDQISHMIQNLDAVIPTPPSVSDQSAFLRLITSSITEPFGGFYLFYWCIDERENTQITRDGGSIVADSGATIYFEGSVANLANVPKSAAWRGKYFHCMVCYRNSKFLTPASPTSHHYIRKASPIDLINEDVPTVPTNQALSIQNNQVIIGADALSESSSVGISYRFDILLNDAAETTIGGNEAALITFYSSTPRFVYDIPFAQTAKSYAHVRICAVSAYGRASASGTLHAPLSFDSSLFNEDLLDYLALKISEKVQTQDGTPLTAK